MQKTVYVVTRARMDVDEGQNLHELEESIKAHGLGPENVITITHVSVTGESSRKPRKYLTKLQLKQRAARKHNKPGGKQLPKGTPPVEHRLPEKPAFMPFGAVDRVKLASDAAMAKRLGIHIEPSEPVVVAAESGHEDLAAVIPIPELKEGATQEMSAVEKFKARQQAHMNGGAANEGNS